LSALLVPFARFALYNVLGALIWTVMFVGAGFFFGNLPVVQHNFTLVVLGIVAVSVVPVILEVLAARREAAQDQQSGGEGSAAAT
jgi:membrane-associated protein